MSPNNTEPNDEYEARLQRGLALALQLDADRVLPFGDTDLCTDRPIVFVHCRIHGEVRCYRVLCEKCGEVHQAEKFVLPPQVPPAGEQVIEAVDLCPCGIERMHAICELCDEAHELYRSGVPSATPAALQVQPHTKGDP